MTAEQPTTRKLASQVITCACLVLSVTALGTICGRAGFAQEDDSEHPYLPGLVATYTDGKGNAFTRLDEAIAFDWRDESPDVRLSAGQFSSRWQGQLFAQGAGEYRLYVFGTGEIEVRLAGKVVVERKGTREAWLASRPVTLDFDYHPLEVSFRKTGPEARIAIYWSGPQFQLEPIPPRSLVHERAASPKSSYSHGEALAAAYRCAACHSAKEEPKAVAGPALDQQMENLQPEWLVEWLKTKVPASAVAAQVEGDGESAPHRPARRMPHLELSDNDARAIAAYLHSFTEPKKDTDNTQQENLPKANPPSATQGERLFLTVGCLACHQLGTLGESGLFGGGDLTNIARKRPAAFFAAWLKEPEKLNVDHRMPVFDLTPEERASLAVFLAEQGKPAAELEPQELAADAVTRGRELVAQHRCASCHRLPKDDRLSAITPPSTASLLSARSDWARSCASGELSAKANIGYGLSAEDQAALQEYYSPQRNPRKSEANSTWSRLAALENNCLACHQREGFESFTLLLPTKLADKLPGIGEVHADLTSLLPAMTPPSLNSVGDKLHDQSLAAAIARRGKPHRDYLLVRMPRFRLSEAQVRQLVDYFVTADRIPARAELAPTPPDSAQQAAWDLAGGRLVVTNGFGCTSCHQVGKVPPDKAPLNARGPILSGLDQRIRKEWFDRFVRNPARIVPRMEMPSVQVPVRGVLGNKLDEQLSAVWHTLNTAGFEPPEPNPVRVLRLSGLRERHEQPTIITDLVKVGDKTLTRPVLIGLPSRHNFLFDLEANRLAGWWLGDIARQRTKGKTWFWEAAGKSIVGMPDEPELSLLLDGKTVGLKPTKEGLGELHGFSTHGADASFEYVVSLDLPDSARKAGESSRRLLITQSFSTQHSDTSSKTSVSASVRRLQLDGAPPGATLVLRLMNDAASKDCNLADDGHTLHMSGEGSTRIRVLSPDKARIFADGSVHVPVGMDTPSGEQRPSRLDLKLEYSTELPVDQYLEPPIPEVLSLASNLEIGPGWQAERLPLPVGMMPTGICWTPDGKLAFCTLQGQVFVADEATLQEGMLPFRELADGLPAPYGIVAGEKMDGKERSELFVATKASVVRVRDNNGSQKRDVAVVAGGWGYSTDYHDWTVGLLRTSSGELIAGLPCQQDQRSAEGAAFRGTMVKLVPRPADTESESRRPFTIQTISSGHRFPMGMALNRDGELFVTDNQGNYNPFNELNHVRQGAFFGFVNASDKAAKNFQPPPLSEPAINIPHPWTRSVNGICFLDTPADLRKETGKEIFGPFEGQLVGCEYDTRRLIRMSLQKVDDTYQGAAYPLSQEAPSPENGFLGPLVCAVSPRGELYVGSIRDSGWGAGNNVGEIVRIKLQPDALPCGIATMTTISEGFRIDFTREVDPAQAVIVANYTLSTFRRVSTPAYGGPDIDQRTEKISRVELSADRRHVTLHLDEMRPGFVYELHVKNISPQAGVLFPAEAYYTLHKVPRP